MTATLLSRYDGLVCDLDGVVYRGQSAVPHAAQALNEAQANGTGIVYATNNASRPPQQVAEHLTRLEVEATAQQVLTSSLAAAQVLRDALGEDAAVLAVGGPGVADALRANSLRPILPREHAEGTTVTGVLQGYGADVSAGDLAEAAYAVQAGARWVATNSDRTLPTDQGMAPGNGTLVDAVRAAVETDPQVVGKPGPLLYQLAARRLGTATARTLGIGDRIETDLAGAHAAHMDALHVLTGVHGLSDLAAAPEGLRPRFVAEDLRALHEPYDEPVEDGDGRWSSGTVHGRLAGEGSSARVELTGGGPGHADRPMAANRVALRVLWQAVDKGLLSPSDAGAAIVAAQ